jgi:hypothetical protein
MLTATCVHVCVYASRLVLALRRVTYTSSLLASGCCPMSLAFLCQHRLRALLDAVDVTVKVCAHAHTRC